MLRSTCIALIILLTALRADASNDVLNWPPDVKAGFRGGIINGLYVLGPSLRSGFAMSDSGALCTFNPMTAEAVVFPHGGESSSLDGAVRQKVGANPSAVAFKRIAKDKAYFVVASTDHTIAVLDARSGLIVSTIQVAALNINGLAAPSHAEVPFVYYTGGDVSAGIVGKIDLETMTDAGVIAMPDQMQYDLVASPDGTMLYGRRPHADNGFTCLKVTTEPPLKATRISDEKHPLAGAIPSLDGQVVASGKQIYTADLSSMVTELPDAPLAFSSSLVFALAGNRQIDVMTASSFKTLEYLVWPFPPSRFASTHRSTGSTTQVTAFYDEKHTNLLLITLSAVAVVSMKDLEVPTDPAVHVELAGDSSLIVGMPWTAKLTPKNPSTHVELAADPPAGLSIVGDQLKWTPGASDIGSHWVTLTLSAGKVKQTQKLPLTVRRKSIALPFVPTLLAISDDGKRAIIARETGSHTLMRNHRSTVDEEQMSRIALIDVQTQTIIADRTLTSPLRAVAVDGHFVYASLRDSDAFIVLSLADLSDVKRLFTAARVWQFETIGDRLYVGISGKPATFFTLPNFDPDPKYTAPSPYENSGTPVPTAANEGSFMNGIIYDDSFKHARRVIQDDSLPAITPMRFSIGNEPSDPAVGMWGVKLRNSAIQRTSGETVVQFPPDVMNGTAVILKDIPVAVALAKEPEVNGGAGVPDRDLAQIECFNLTSGERLGPIAIADEVRNPVSDIPADPHFAANGGVMAVQWFDQLYLVPTSDISRDRVTQTFQISVPDGTIVIPGDKPTTIALSVTGGTHPISFSFGEELPGVQIDAESGSLTIDPTPLLGRSVDAIVQFAQQRFNFDPATNSPRTPQASLAAYRASASDHVKSLTGNAPAGYPAALPLMVIARDSQQQLVRLMLTLIVDVPAGQVESKIASANLPAVQFHPPTPATMPDGTAALRQRVSNLEEQNRQLQAKVDALLDALSRNGGASTRPAR